MKFKQSLIAPVCIPPDSLASCVPLIKPCTAPSPGSTFVKELCQKGSIASGTLGTDTVLSGCTLPKSGEYVSATCSPGSPSHFVGTDTEVSECSEPTVGEFVVSTCITGSQSATGQDTVVQTCSQPGTLQYTSSTCRQGDALSTAGADAVIGDCSAEPDDGEYVASLCLSGA